jgi:hypothetical protein
MGILLVFLTLLGPVICNPNLYAVENQSRNVAQAQLLRPRGICEPGYGFCQGTYPFRARFKVQKPTGVVRPGFSAAPVEVVFFRTANVSVRMEHVRLDHFVVARITAIP